MVLLSSVGLLRGQGNQASAYGISSPRLSRHCDTREDGWKRSRASWALRWRLPRRFAPRNDRITRTIDHSPDRPGLRAARPWLPPWLRAAIADSFTVGLPGITHPAPRGHAWRGQLTESAALPAPSPQVEISCSVAPKPCSTRPPGSPRLRPPQGRAQMPTPGCAPFYWHYPPPGALGSSAALFLFGGLIGVLDVTDPRLHRPHRWAGLQPHPADAACTMPGRSSPAWPRCCCWCARRCSSATWC